MPNLSKTDEYEQTAAGLSELLQRFKAARTMEEFRLIATEAERRAAQPSLESTIKTPTAYWPTWPARVWRRSFPARELMQRRAPELVGNAPHQENSHIVRCYE
jgi:hypothetical protein